MSNELNVYSRRDFLGASLAVVSGAATVPLFLEQSALAAGNAAAGSRPGKPDDRILVVVQLSGGNDGLNTVVPFGDDAYYKARPSIGIKPNEALKLGVDGLGLNPALAPIHAMYNEGLAAAVLGVGYPNPNRSHFVSMDIWHTADPEGGRRLGWLGKALDSQHAERAKQGKRLDPSIMIAIGDNAPLAGEGKRVKAVTFDNPTLFRWSGSELHPELSREYDKLNREGAAMGMPNDADHAALAGMEGGLDGGLRDQAAFIMRTALDAQVSSDRIRNAVRVQPTTPFPQLPLANGLRHIAAMIRAELPTRVYYVRHGGFDTHANQINSQRVRLTQFAQSIRAFYNEMKAIGQQDRVLTLAFSEFGRRVKQNASAGTDHGTAGPMFMFGPMVKPGVHGKQPSLTELDKNGDLIHNVDFRSVYASVLDQWLKVDSQTVLGRKFEPTSVLRA